MNSTDLSKKIVHDRLMGVYKTESRITWMIETAAVKLIKRLCEVIIQSKTIEFTKENFLTNDQMRVSEIISLTLLHILYDSLCYEDMFIPNLCGAKIEHLSSSCKRIIRHINHDMLIDVYKVGNMLAIESAVNKLTEKICEAAIADQSWGKNKKRTCFIVLQNVRENLPRALTSIIDSRSSIDWLYRSFLFNL